MGAIKSRKKSSDQDEVIKQAARAADEIADRPYGKEKRKEPKAIRCNFSLTEEVSERIDDLTGIKGRVSRSDIVKAALIVFEGLSKSDQLEAINKIK